MAWSSEAGSPRPERLREPSWPDASPPAGGAAAGRDQIAALRPDGVRSASGSEGRVPASDAQLARSDGCETTARDLLPRLCRRKRAGPGHHGDPPVGLAPPDPRLPTVQCGHRRQGPPPSPGDCDDLFGPERRRPGAALQREADVRVQRLDWMDPSMHRAPNDEPITSANGSVASWPCFRCPHRSAGQPRNSAAARDPPGRGRKEERTVRHGAPLDFVAFSWKLRGAPSPGIHC